MQLISDDYRKINEELHDRNRLYGTKGYLYIDNVMVLANKYKTTDILDYGCGKSTLANNLGFPINQYDPAIEKYKELPEPADIVICTDVLEHLEPEYLDNVLAHLASLTKKVGFFTVHLKEAQKTLEDGRNAHLIIMPREKWEEKISEKFKILESTLNDFMLALLVAPKEVENP